MAFIHYFNVTSVRKHCSWVQNVGFPPSFRILFVLFWIIKLQKESEFISFFSKNKRSYEAVSFDPILNNGKSLRVFLFHFFANRYFSSCCTLFVVNCSSSLEILSLSSGFFFFTCLSLQLSSFPKSLSQKARFW